MEAKRRRRRNGQPTRLRDRLRPACHGPRSSTARWPAHALRSAWCWIGLPQRHLDARDVRRGECTLPSHNPRSFKAAITSRWSQPAWHRTSTLPSSSRIERLGSRSSWAGQRAVQPCPTFRPPSALAMVSAVIAHPHIIGVCGVTIVVGRVGPFGPRPFGQDGKEAGDVCRICFASSRLRSRPRRGCQTSRVRAICSSFRLSFAAFTEDLTGGSRRSAPLISGLGLPPMTLDRIVFASSASQSQGSPVGAVSARHLFLGDRELVGLARPDHEVAPAALGDPAEMAQRKWPCLRPSTTSWPIRSRASPSWGPYPGGRGVGRFFKHCAAMPSCP